MSRSPANVRSARAMHRRDLAAVRGMGDQSGSGMHITSTAVFLRCHAAAPPAVARYDDWLASLVTELSKHGHSTITGTKLRRMVVMKRGGQSLAEIGRAVGISAHTASKWLKSLPQELAA